MSGGVDSAVAAARLVEAGHDVVGVHLALSRNRGTLRTGSRGCCTVEDALDARRAANLLGIPFYVWDFSERFADDVVDDFISEYAAGRTPNPCLRCNERIKFAAVLEKALALGFDAVATGHYAEIREDADGHRELHRAAAWAKDQSYVLGVLTAEQLEHAVFPLGATPSKDEVRAEAAARGLTVAAKPDSYDICFIPDGDTRGWLADKMGAEPGEILDQSGAKVGTHAGAHAFTVGQRKGLNLGVPAPDGRPRFVLEVRPVTNQVVVGRRRRSPSPSWRARASAGPGGRPRMPRPASPATCRCARTASPSRRPRGSWMRRTARRTRPASWSSVPRQPSTASRPVRAPSSTSARVCSVRSRSTGP